MRIAAEDRVDVNIANSLLDGQRSANAAAQLAAAENALAALTTQPHFYETDARAPTIEHTFSTTASDVDGEQSRVSRVCRLFETCCDSRCEDRPPGAASTARTHMSCHGHGYDVERSVGVNHIRSLALAAVRCRICESQDAPGSQINAPVNC
eukprot:SAG31_NODE_479_length_15133_cov_39.816283_8_plen_152_part_00